MSDEEMNQQNIEEQEPKKKKKKKKQKNQVIFIFISTIFIFVTYLPLLLNVHWSSFCNFLHSFPVLKLQGIHVR